MPSVTAADILSMSTQPVNYQPIVKLPLRAKKLGVVNMPATYYEDDEEIEEKEITLEEMSDEKLAEHNRKKKISYVKGLTNRINSHSNGGAFDDDVMEASFENDVIDEIKDVINQYKTSKLKQKTIEKIVDEHPEFFEELDWKEATKEDFREEKKKEDEPRYFLTEEQVADIKKQLAEVNARLAKVESEYLNIKFDDKDNQSYGFGTRSLSFYSKANSALLAEEIKHLVNYKMLLMDRLLINQNNRNDGFGTLTGIYGTTSNHN